MTQHSPSPTVHACVLAAGSSTRFGATKLIQPFRGKPLVQHAISSAMNAFPGRVSLVVGHDEESVVRASGDLGHTLVINSDYRSGLGTSIAAGVLSCRDKVDAIIILLADQPLVTSEHLTQIVDSWSGAEDEIVASSFDETAGPPILFPRAAFNALTLLVGDTGAKSLLNDSGFHVRKIAFPPAAHDIDTPDELRKLDER